MSGLISKGHQPTRSLRRNETCDSGSSFSFGVTQGAIFCDRVAMMTRMNQDNPCKALRALLDRPGVLRSLGAHDVLTAMVIEQAGFELMFVGGFGVSASSHGLPDLNFLGMSEMAEVIRRMTARLSVPLIADGDTGYGDVHNVTRCAAEYASAGAAGMILEDQVFPKRCGHFDGKSVISASDMVAKHRAARRAVSDSDFVIVARTDARATHGLDDAIDRVLRYCDAGADVAFIEAPMSREELEAIAKRVPQPKLVNMLSFGKTPLLPAEELEQMGYKIVVAPIETLLVTVAAVRELAEALLKRGETAPLEEKMVSFDEIKRVLGLDGYLSS